MIEAADLGGALQESALFSNLPEHEIDIVAGLVHEGSVTHGEYLFLENEPSDCLYIVRSGTLEVEKQISPQVRLRIARIGPGDVLGEMGLICSEPRSLSALALENVEYWKLSRADFERLCHSQPSVGLRVAQNIAIVLSHRLVTTNRGIARLFVHFDSNDSTPQREIFVDVLSQIFRVKRQKLAGAEAGR